MDACCLDAVVTQYAHLIFHERNERGDHYADSLFCQCRHLECDTLAASGGHQTQSVPAAADTLDNLFLYASETVVTPVLFKYLQVGHIGLSGFLFRHIGLDTLYLEQNLTLLEVVFLDGIADIKRLFGLDIAHV